MNEKLPVLCLLGPTAAGKTDTAIALLDKYPVEIVSVDSAQVYRQMDIGTAKPDADTLLRAPHALINLLDPWEQYSVARFIEDAHVEIKRIHAHNKIPLLAGGTMLYFQSFWHGLSNLPKTDPAVRDRITQYAQEHGQQGLFKRLEQVDPESAKRIHSNDPQRIMRALEVFEISGVTLSSLQNQRAPKHHYSFYNIGLFPQDRKVLHARIAQRFDQMLEMGFEDEVQKLKQLPQMNSDLASMRCVGYRQMWQYLSDECDRIQMKDRAVAATRQLAKRQITWLRSMDNCQMLDPFTESVMLKGPAFEDLDSWMTSGLDKLNVQT